MRNQRQMAKQSKYLNDQLRLIQGQENKQQRMTNMSFALAEKESRIEYLETTEQHMLENL